VQARYLRVSVTDRCNLRCSYCTPMKTRTGAPKQDLLTHEEIASVVRVAASLGVSKVRLTGGEPLRRPGIEFLIREIAQIPDIQDRGLTTNGVRLRDFVPALARARFRVNVHLDTLIPERYREVMGGPGPESAIEGVLAAVDAGIAVKLNAVCTAETTRADVESVLEFAKDLRVPVRFIEAMPVSGVPLDEGAHTAIRALEAALRRHWSLIPQPGDGVARMYRGLDTGVQVGFVTPSSAHFCDGCTRLRLSARGIVRTCLYARDGIDLRPFLRARDLSGLREALLQSFAIKHERAGREGTEILTMMGIGG